MHHGASKQLSHIGVRPNSSATAPQAPASRPATRKGLSAAGSPWSVLEQVIKCFVAKTDEAHCQGPVNIVFKHQVYANRKEERIERETFSDEVKDALQQKIHGGARLPHASGSIVT